MATRQIVRPYRPHFQSALQRSRLSWDTPEDLCPTTKRVDRMMSSIRRLPGQEMTLAQARAENEATKQKCEALDLNRWRLQAWALGLEVHDA